MTALFRVLVALYPPAFRRQFGEDLEEQLRVDWSASRRRGRIDAAATLIALSADAVKCAVAEWWSPSWQQTRDRISRRHAGRRSGSIDWREESWSAIRALRRAPVMTGLCTVMLGLALAVNALLFSVLEVTVVNPLPYRDAGRLVHVEMASPQVDTRATLSVRNAQFLKSMARSGRFEDVSTYEIFTKTLRTNGWSERIWLTLASSSLFDALGGEPMLGRLPSRSDEGSTVVLGHAAWTSRFDADPAIIGRSIHVAGRDRTVIAVMPPGFWFPDDRVQLWLPTAGATLLNPQGDFGRQFVARIAAGADPATLSNATLPGADVRPLATVLLAGLARPLPILLAIGALLLVVASANTGTLFALRVERKRRDHILRRALGAGRARLVRSQLLGSLFAATLAALLALPLAAAILPRLAAWAPATLQGTARLALTPFVVAMVFAAALLSAGLSAIVPVMLCLGSESSRLLGRAPRISSPPRRARDALVVAQTALTLVACITAALLIRSVRALRAVDPGYTTADIFTFQTAPEGAHLEGAAAFARFHLDVAQRIAALPDVEAVGLVEDLPLDVPVRHAPFRTRPAVDVDGREAVLGYTWAAGDYFRVMDIALLGGRAFNESDHTTHRGYVLVSASAARTLWPGENPLGKQLQRTDLQTWETVIGVVEDVVQDDLRDAPAPLVYLPLVAQAPDSWTVPSPAYVVKTGRPEEIEDDVRAIVRSAAPDAPIYRTFTMASLAARSMQQLSFTTSVSSTVSLLALLFGVVGLSGVVSCTVAERTREIGIRIALGAERTRLQRTVVRHAMRVVLLGVAIGVVIAAAITPALHTLLFRVAPLDGRSFATMTALMLLAGLIAACLPARWISHVDPLRSIHVE